MATWMDKGSKDAIMLQKITQICMLLMYKCIIIQHPCILLRCAGLCLVLAIMKMLCISKCYVLFFKLTIMRMFSSWTFWHAFKDIRLNSINFLDTNITIASAISSTVAATVAASPTTDALTVTTLRCNLNWCILFTEIPCVFFH